MIRFINSASASSASFASKTFYHNNRWNAIDIEFFDSYYDDKTAVIASIIEHTEKDIYFKNVYVFIERVKNLTIIKKDESIKTNLYNCLRNIVLK